MTRVFGLDKRYLDQDPSIRIVDGSFEPGSGLLSAEAARALSIRPGGFVQVPVPGMSQPLNVRISGITDVSRAKSLFYSREGKQLEQFVYVRNTVIVGPDVFADDRARFSERGYSPRHDPAQRANPEGDKRAAGSDLPRKFRSPISQLA